MRQRGSSEFLSKCKRKAKRILRSPVGAANAVCRAMKKISNVVQAIPVAFRIIFDLGRFIGVIFGTRASQRSETVTHANESPPCILAIALSTGVSEPRLLRQVVTATQLGFHTGFVGLPAEASFSNQVKIQRCSSVLVGDQLCLLDKLILAAIHEATKRLLLFGRVLPPSPFFLRHFTRSATRVLLSIHWISPPGFFSVWRATCQSVSSEFVRMGRVRLVIAHDFFTLLPGLYAARLLQVPLLLDIHEYATGQYDTAQFKSEIAPLIRSFQQEFFCEVDYFSIVSLGILNQLVLDYPGISNRVHLCRNIPSRHLQSSVSCPSSVNPEDIQILYSGLLCAGRGLEQLVNAFRLLPSNYSLHLVGPIDEGFLSPLVSGLHVHDRARIVIHAMVDYADIISFNNRFDIGYFAQPQYSPQKQYSLPNKFFEYIHAGLCLCIDNSSEMAAIVRARNLGIVLTSYDDPIYIANQILLLDVQQIRTYKQNSFAASSSYTWEAETLDFTRFLLSR